MLPPGTNAAANAINNSGQVVGGAFDGPGHAFLYSSGKMTDLGTLGGDFSAATALNNSGQIIGYSTLTSGFMDAFLYQNGKMTDLTDLIKSLGGITIEPYVGLHGINDSGQIVVTAGVDGNVHSFLLTPNTVPEPTTLALLAFGGAALVAKRLRCCAFKSDRHSS